MKWLIKARQGTCPSACDILDLSNKDDLARGVVIQEYSCPGGDGSLVRVMFSIYFPDVKDAH